MRVGALALLLAAALAQPALAQAAYGVAEVSVRIYGYVRNLGPSPLPLNETDLFVFNYPVEGGGQRVLSASAWAAIGGSNATYPFRVEGGPRPALVVEAPFSSAALATGSEASAGVEYLVEVDVGSRFLEASDFVFAYATGNETPLFQKALPLSLTPELGRYVEPTSGWNYTNPLVALAVEYVRSQAGARLPLALLKAAVLYVSSNVEYSIRQPPREPWEVLLFWQGDCDDQSNLLVTLLRGLGVPAYQEFGVVYVGEGFNLSFAAEGGLLRVEMVGGGGHAWAAAYVPPWGWVRVDTVFGFPGNWLSHIASAPYYSAPVVVLGRSSGEAEQLSALSFGQRLRASRAEYAVFQEVKLIRSSR